jgi:hypothetical protein
MHVKDARRIYALASLVGTRPSLYGGRYVLLPADGGGFRNGFAVGDAEHQFLGEGIRGFAQRFLPSRRRSALPEYPEIARGTGVRCCA